MHRQRVQAWCLLVGILLTGTACAETDYSQQIQPLLERLCYDCHGNGADEGGMQLDSVDSIEALLADRKRWGKVWDNVLTEMMPPADMPQPTEAERQQLSRWIGEQVFQVSTERPDPGRVTIRRLNRVEYRFAVLDLLGVKFNVVEHFPVDDIGYGFDTIGDVLTVPPSLMDKYFGAAEQITEEIRLAAKDDKSRVYRRLFGNEPLPDKREQKRDRARQVIRRIATRAFRQPVDERTLERLWQLTDRDSKTFSVVESVCRAVEAILVSPRFIYRAEFQPGPDDPTSVHPLDEYALASRLSFFLWSSLPDDQLFELAERGQLRNQLDSQVARMLKDEKSSRFVDSFVGQWLNTRHVEGIHRSGKLMDALRGKRHKLVEETHRFFTHVMREDRDVMELLTANYSFLNQDIAKLYGMKDVKGNHFRLVNFEPDSPRGGLLTHGSVLLITSNPDRTSPVKRGQFILDSFLGTPSPPAPPDVPDLEEVTRGVNWHISMREQLAIHREDPGCASCHNRMDPLGLGLENFDAIGRWRDSFDGFEIDATGTLASGETFNGVRELRDILGTKRRLFYRCLTKKLMIYALGRGIEYTDNPAIEAIVDQMIAPDATGNRGRFSTMLMAIVQSPQFQMRRGNGHQANGD